MQNDERGMLVTNSIQEELGKCNPGKVFNSIEKISEYLLNISNEY